MGMDFFKTDKGIVHVGRLAFVGYVIATVLCMVGHAAAGVGGTLITFAMGWWVAFCGKRPPLRWTEYNSGVRLRFGLALCVTPVFTEVFRLLFIEKHYRRMPPVSFSRRYPTLQI